MVFNQVKYDNASIIIPKIQQVFTNKINVTPPRSGYNVVLVQSPNLPLLSPY
jgi:hypothetical protein